MALIAQEVSQEREIEIPEPVREIYKLWRPAPLIRARRLEKVLDTPARIFYKYEGVSPPGSHKPNTAVAAGLLQQGSRHQEADHRDRRRPVGLFARLRRRALRHRGQGLHGQGQLQSEALPQGHDGDLRRDLRRQPERPTTNSGRATLALDPNSSGQPRHRHLRGGRGRRQEPRRQLLAGQRAQPRPDPPVGDRHRGHRADGNGRLLAGRGHRLHRRRVELRRPRLPLPRQEAARGQDPASGRRRARGLPVADPRRLCL